MNILLGAHSTGKSTLLEKIRESHPHVFTTDGFSRPVKVAKEKSSMSTVQEQIVLNELTCWAYENYINYKNLISTRSPIDAIIYTEYYLKGLKVQHIQDCFDKHKDKIDNIFYIPIEFPIVNDGVRFTDEQDRINIDLAIQKYIKDNNLPVIVLTGSVEERANTVLQHLNYDKN